MKHLNFLYESVNNEGWKPEVVYVKFRVMGIAFLWSEAILVLFLSHEISHRPLLVSTLQFFDYREVYNHRTPGSDQ